MAQRRVLTVGAGGDPGAVFAALAEAYTVHADPVETVRWTWLDTADWRVQRAGLAVREERRGRHRALVLDRPSGSELTAPLTGPGWPARLDRLPPSPVREHLADVVGVRALLPLAEVESRHILLRLMDAADKTRVRVSVAQQRLLTPRRAALPLHLVVTAVRGYDRDAQRCVDLLTAAMAAQATDLSPTGAALAAAGHLPCAPGPDGAPDAAVGADDPAVRPVARALLRDVGVVDATRDGAIADLDVEFLHDLRSAIRSTRALLAAAGHLLPGRSAVRVDRDLAWLDEMTTPLRAVDIALHELEGTSGLELDGLTALDPLRAELHRRRRSELQRMRRTLRADRAPAAFTAWRSDLRPMLDADLIGPTAGEAARTLVATTYRGVAEADDTALGERIGSMRAVLAAFGPVLGPDVERVAADLDELYELVRRRDGARIVAQEVTRATSAALPVPTLLTAGALLDRAARLERERDQQLAARRTRFVGARAAARVTGLTTDDGPGS